MPPSGETVKSQPHGEIALLRRLLRRGRYRGRAVGDTLLQSGSRWFSQRFVSVCCVIHPNPTRLVRINKHKMVAQLKRLSLCLGPCQTSLFPCQKRCLLRVNVAKRRTATLTRSNVANVACSKMRRSRVAWFFFCSGTDRRDTDNNSSHTPVSERGLVFPFSFL